MKIERKGGLDAIVVSHPHYYTSYVEWASRFQCPVYISMDDEEWICREAPREDMIKFIEGPVGTSETILPGVTAIKAGGHFPGSLVLHWDDQLFIADTIVTVPVNHRFRLCHSRIQGSRRFSLRVHPIHVLRARRAIAFNGLSRI